MTLWIALVGMCLVALGFIVWPLLHESRRLTAVIAAVIVVVVAASAGLYHHIGNPGVPSGAGTMPNIDEMVAALEKRLEKTPDDVNGWRMLGRSYQTLKRYDESMVAIEKVVQLENGQNGQSFVDMALVLMDQNGGQMSDRAAGLFENALAVEPNNPNALFYGGGVAAQRGDIGLAADRWEILLGLNAPPEVQGLLQRKVNEWRGLPPPQVAQSSAAVTINLSVSDDAKAQLPADATIYVIARDPAQPSPPIAVTPRRLSELPTVVTLTDRDAMVPGRSLSNFAEVEIVARVSLSGQPMAQSGDWMGSMMADTAAGTALELLIDQKVP